MPDKTPQINATGSFTLRTPFTINSSLVYRCEAISGFEALKEKGVDVYAKYYKPLGLSTTVYQDDAANGINIVTLMSENGATIDVPSSYIDSYPSDQSVPYGNLFIVVDLGPLPSSISLDQLRSNISDMATAMSGKPATTHVLRVPMAGFVSTSQASALEAARISSITNEASMYAAKVGLEDELARANQKITALQTIIKTNF